MPNAEEVRDLKPRLIAIMCTVSAMFLLAFCMLAPWISVTRTVELYGGGHSSQTSSFHLDYYVDAYSRIYTYDDDNPLGNVLDNCMIVVVAWLALAVLFVRLCLGMSRILTIVGGAILLIVSLSVALYFPIASAYAAIDAYQAEDVVVSYTLAVGYFLAALATVLQCAGILQLLYFADEFSWKGILLKEAEELQ